jgi:hypothetical protein
MCNRRIDARLTHAGKFSRPFHLPAFGESAVGLRHVPIPGLGQDQPLRCLEAERIQPQPILGRLAGGSLRLHLGGTLP